MSRHTGRTSNFSRSPNGGAMPDILDNGSGFHTRQDGGMSTYGDESVTSQSSGSSEPYFLVTDMTTPSQDVDRRSPTRCSYQRRLVVGFIFVVMVLSSGLTATATLLIANNEKSIGGTATLTSRTIGATKDATSFLNPTATTTTTENTTTIYTSGNTTKTYSTTIILSTPDTQSSSTTTTPPPTTTAPLSTSTHPPSTTTPSTSTVTPTTTTPATSSSSTTTTLPPTTTAPSSTSTHPPSTATHTTSTVTHTTTTPATSSSSTTTTPPPTTAAPLSTSTQPPSTTTPTISTIKPTTTPATSSSSTTTTPPPTTTAPSSTSTHPPSTTTPTTSTVAPTTTTTKTTTTTAGCFRKCHRCTSRNVRCPVNGTMADHTDITCPCGTPCYSGVRYDDENRVYRGCWRDFPTWVPETPSDLTCREVKRHFVCVCYGDHCNTHDMTSYIPRS